MAIKSEKLGKGTVIWNPKEFEDSPNFLENHLRWIYEELESQNQRIEALERQRPKLRYFFREDEFDEKTINGR